MGNTPEFPAEKVKRPRHKKKQLDYESNDLATLDPEQQFRVQCFNTLVDTALQSVEHRFEQLQEHCGYFSILYDIHNVRDLDKDELRNCERGFSTMKRVKTPWRNHLKQETLDNLIMISIEGANPESFDFNAACDSWAGMSKRRLHVTT
ncbi:hypothetical protein EOD39_19279 [Acipenser ruthenus]|uniref:Uncharacterized protein n=1 Tax=Acipenser ruthenus TaxID=7906 RepID=A0A444UYK0_ACIRT|nr:hypothetical protein EOD39_19279 [Acipenser ruthenus]